MKESENIYEAIDKYRDEVIRIQAELTARPALGTQNGGRGEHEKAAYVRQLLGSLEPDFIEEFRAPDTKARDGYRPNLAALWKGSGSGQRVWVLSHMDIVPPGDLSLWHEDPYTVRVEGDRITGRGVEDNQHGFVSSFLALKAVLEGQGTPVRDVGLAVVADEETGSEKGLSYLLREHAELFHEDDLIIVPDGGNEEGTMIEIAEKSMLWLSFTVTGKQCHGSTPDKGRNSLRGVAALVIALEKGLKKRFDASDDLFSPARSTFEPTKIEANVPNINTIPGRDVFYMDCRVLPCYKVDEVLEECRSICAGVSEKLDLKMEMDIRYRQDATEPTSRDSAVARSLKDAIGKITGKEAKPMGIGGGTVAAFFRRAGFPAAVWSTVSDTAHQPNEYCLISNVLTDAKIFASIYLEDEQCL